MGTRRVFLIAFAFALLIGVSALAQGPTYGVGRTPTVEEIRALDISIGPTGEELPPGKGTATEGAQVYRAKGCAGCHGAAGIGGTAPNLKSKDPKNPDVWARGRILPLRAPFATTVWDYINRWMPGQILDRTNEKGLQNLWKPLEAFGCGGAQPTVLGVYLDGSIGQKRQVNRGNRLISYGQPL